MQITKNDITIALYGEITNQIARGSDELIAAKIASGTGEVSSYLNRYDVDTIFGADWQNDFFKELCVNVIAWKLIGLARGGVDYEIKRTAYEDAIKFLTNVQKGFVRPDWPLRADDPDTDIDDAGNIQWSSNSKRNNHY